MRTEVVGAGDLRPLLSTMTFLGRRRSPVPVPPNGLTVYRFLRGPDLRQEDFESAYTRPQAQLRGIPELSRASISHFAERGEFYIVEADEEGNVLRVFDVDDEVAPPAAATRS